MSNTQKSSTEDAEDVSFDLTGLAAVAEKAGVDIDASPEAENAAALADAEKLAQEEFEKSAAAPAESDKPGETDEEKAAKLFAEADAKKAAEEAAASAGQTDEEKAAAEAAKAEADAAKAEADAKAAENAAAAKARAAEDAETVHMRPSQKKAWSAMKAEREAARAEAAAAKAAAEAAKTRIAELEAAKASVEIPEAIKKETEELRQIVRELSAEKDPEITRKYDTPIKASEDAAIEILKKYKYDKMLDAEGKPTIENPQAISDLRKSGVTLGNLAKSITALEKAGHIEDAEMLREHLRDARRLGQAKQAEIQAIKGDVENRTKARQTQSVQQQQEAHNAVTAEANRVLAEELGAISKKHTFLVKPSILATDTPAVQAAKKAQLAEFDKFEAKIGEVAKTISTVGKGGKEYVSAEARKNALAIESIVLKERVLPHLEAANTSLTARVKELESELAKLKGAGSISRAHGTAAQSGGKKAEVNPNLSTADAMKEFASKMGVPVNS